MDTEELAAGAHNSTQDGVNPLEDDVLQKMDIQVELQPIELTREEE